ncbi:hypothetical protein ACN27F_29050 [Solwaraspora sp. WMMB335]|uniref:hypothetical protein n=1 Tax=Solwaraspora sp. WMMB335 TaxID=3404118 RepID=UPI003B942976
MRTRCRSALSCGIMAGLASGAMIGVPVGDSTRPNPPLPADRFVASQPDLAPVLLGPDDLPAGYRLVAHAVGSGSAVVDVAETGPVDVDRCRRLFERPWSAAAVEQPPRDQVVAHHLATGSGAALRQSLTLLAPDSATTVAGRIGALAHRCVVLAVSVPASLDDGSPVAVRFHRQERFVGGGTGWSVLLSIASAGAADGVPPQAGFLSVTGQGGVLTTVRHLGPIGAVTPGDAVRMASRAAAKVDPDASLLRPAAR